MTVHDFVQSLGNGEAQPVPPNCNGPQLVYYAKSRFNLDLVTFNRGGREHIGRECPACGVRS